MPFRKRKRKNRQIDNLIWVWSRGQLHQWLVLSDPPDPNRALALLGHIKQIRPLPDSLKKYEELARNLHEANKPFKLPRPRGYAVWRQM